MFPDVKPGHYRVSVSVQARHTPHSRSVVSAFVVRCQDKIIPVVLLTFYIPIPRLWLASVTEQSGLSLTLSQTSEVWGQYNINGAL